MSSSDYSNPKWQKKRLEKLNAANFECEHCGDKENTLHVHHTYYDSSKKLWEYSTDDLMSLCAKCHSEYTVRQKYIRKMYQKVCRHLGQNHVDGCIQGLYKAMLLSEGHSDNLDAIDGNDVDAFMSYFMVSPRAITHNIKLIPEHLLGHIIHEIEAFFDYSFPLIKKHYEETSK